MRHETGNLVVFILTVMFVMAICVFLIPKNVHAGVFILAQGANNTGVQQTVIATTSNDLTNVSFSSLTCDVELSGGTVNSANVIIRGSAYSNSFDPTGMFTIACTNAQLVANKCSGGTNLNKMPFSLLSANITAWNAANNATNYTSFSVAAVIPPTAVQVGGQMAKFRCIESLLSCRVIYGHR